MKKSTYLLLLSLLIISCKFFSTQKNDLNEYPYLGNSIDAYFHTYHTYPNNMDQLLSFIKNEKLYHKTYVKLKRNIDDFNIISNDTLYVIMDNHKRNILKTHKVNICERLKKYRLDLATFNNILLFHRGDNLSKNKDGVKYADSLRAKVSLLLKKEKTQYEFTDLEYVTFYENSTLYNCSDKGYNNSYVRQLENIFLSAMNEKDLDSIKLILPILNNSELK